MKIQCSCGAKYEFEVTADMAQKAVEFVCPACGLDSSAFVTGLVRQELGQAPAAGSGPAAQGAPAPVGRPGARLGLPSAESGQPERAPPLEEQRRRCARHRTEWAVGQCCICSKPICRRCMELFGYVCGPHCKAKAEANGIEVPAYAGLKSAVQARLWRKTGRIATAIGLAAVAVLGFWFWYAWIGSKPRVAFSIRFAEAAYSGQSAFAGPGQIVFLHGGLLARHDLKANKEIWSRQLLDEKELDAAVARERKEMEAAVERASQTDPDHVPRMPSPDRLKLGVEKAAAAALDLRVRGQNIWVVSPGKLVRYDWETGRPEKEVALAPGAGGIIGCGDELLLMGEAGGDEPCVTRINLATCESRRETLGGVLASNVVAAAPGGRGSGLAGLPVGVPGKDAGKAMDPGKVAQQAQHMSLPARIALPAVLSSSRAQERALAEMSEAPARAAANSPAAPGQSVSLVPTKDGILQLSARLVERKVVTRSAMKAAPAKSALDGNLSIAKTTEASNEILNDMQRSRGSDVVQEDESRYLVKVEGAEGKEGWSGEVIGAPALLPLETVNVVAANKTLVVLDKANRKLWQATLSYNLNPELGGGENGPGLYGQGPCVEHKGGLYVIDQGALTAFELATGNVRWRLPAVGIAGVFFDEQDNIYVNSSTASLDAVKYSRQIDISQKTQAVVLKIDSRTGKTLWQEQPGGMLSYVSGKFVYAVQSYMPEEPDEDGPAPVETGFETPPYLRIKRLNARTGHEMWEHFEQRAPLDVQFDKNRIRLVFKKEVEVLKFVAF